MNIPDEALRKLPGLDCDAALTNCGGHDALLDTMRVYFETAPSRAEDISRSLDAGDIRQYTILVHALKSSSRLVGFLSLSEQALRLEEAGNALDIALIGEKTPALLADYGAVIDALTPYFGEADDSEKPEITTEALQALYDRLLAYAGEFDLDGMDEVTAQIKGFRLPESERERFSRIQKTVTEADYGALEALLRS